jgi:hypothetical protein
MAVDWSPWKKPEVKPPVVEEGAEHPPEKTPAEIIAESVSAAVTAGLKPISEQIEAQNARFTKLEEQTKPREVKPPVTPGEPTSVLDDENLAFAQRLTPILARQFEMESTIVRDKIVREYMTSGYGDLVTQFEGEINTILDSAPLVTNEGKPFRGDPQYVRNVIDMVLGRAARKAGMRFDGKSKGFFLEPANGSANDSTRESGDGMTESQRKVFGRMGVPLEEAKKVMSKLHFVA